MNKKLIIVMPCYNEEKMLPQTIGAMGQLLDRLITEQLVSPESKICFVNDGSRDNTWPLIVEAAGRDTKFMGISLSRNFGHQGALLAGVFSVQADMVVTMDADLQDDPECIREMVKRHHDGDEIVYGVREKRETDTVFKKYTALGFYTLMKALGVKVVYNHADFRLMGSRAIDAMRHYGERNLFLRAVVPLLGFKSSCVYYNRATRTAGETKYPFHKMFAFAMNGVFSFSVVPLRLISCAGFLSFLFSVALLAHVLYSLMMDKAVPGWSSTVCAIAFFSGMILISLGVVGEYIARIFIEVKNRPLYLVDEKVNF